MKYFLIDTWCNDDTIHTLPEGATELSDSEWDNRQARPDGWIPEPIIYTYSQLRAAEYNLKTVGEQFGMQYDDLKENTATWLTWQDEIKAKYPK